MAKNISVPRPVVNSNQQNKGGGKVSSGGKVTTAIGSKPTGQLAPSKASKPGAS
jgi:hypothetical protein